MRTMGGINAKAGLDKMACAAVVLWALIINSDSLGQDLLRHVDLASPEMTTAEMTRADVNIEKGSPVDLSDRRLSGLDLSELNLRVRSGNHERRARRRVRSMTEAA